MGTERNEEELLHNLRSNNSKLVNDSFRILYRNYYGLIRDFVLKNSGTTADVKDVFQEGLIAFYNQVFHKKVVLTCSIKTYLYSICRNIWFAKLRKVKREVSLEEQDSFIELGDDMVFEMIRKEQSGLIAQLIKSLGIKCKEILMQFYYLNHSIEEITERINSPSKQATKTKKSRCMDQIRQKIRDNSHLSNLIR